MGFVNLGRPAPVATAAAPVREAITMKKFKVVKKKVKCRPMKVASFFPQSIRNNLPLKWLAYRISPAGWQGQAPFLFLLENGFSAGEWGRSFYDVVLKQLLRFSLACLVQKTPADKNRIGPTKYDPLPAPPPQYTISN